MASDQLREAVATRTADLDAPGELAAFGPPDPERILQILGLNPRDPKAHAVVAVCQRYGLDPLLGHVVLIGESRLPYITRDGYLYVAHASGQLDGMEVIDGPRRDGPGREWTATVAVYRKDMSKAFAYPGRCDTARENGPEMALARSERRGLKRAFKVSVPGGVFIEDEGDPRAAPRLARAQVQAIQAAFKERGIGRADRLALVSQWAGRPVASVSDLTPTEATEALARLAEQRSDTEQTAPAAPLAGEGTAEGAGQGGESDPGPAPAITRAQQRELTARLRDMGYGRDDALRLLGGWTGRTLGSTADLTTAEFAGVMTRLDAEAGEAGGDG
jgi:hypothetical protein